GVGVRQAAGVGWYAAAVESVSNVRHGVSRRAVARRALPAALGVVLSPAALCGAHRAVRSHRVGDGRCLLVRAGVRHRSARGLAGGGGGGLLWKRGRRRRRRGGGAGGGGGGGARAGWGAAVG